MEWRVKIIIIIIEAEANIYTSRRLCDERERSEGERESVGRRNRSYITAQEILIANAHEAFLKEPFFRVADVCVSIIVIFHSLLNENYYYCCLYYTDADGYLCITIIFSFAHRHIIFFSFAHGVLVKNENFFFAMTKGIRKKN